MSRNMLWGDIVPLGYFATWACEPNPTLAEIKERIRTLIEGVDIGNLDQILPPDLAPNMSPLTAGHDPDYDEDGRCRICGEFDAE